MDEAVESLRKKSKSDNVHGKILDLASFTSIRMFCKEILAAEKKISILICNAGVMGFPKKALTEDGLEMQMGVNHFGHFLLTNLLLERMKESAPSRIVILSSMAHKTMAKKLRIDDLNSERSYEGFQVYGETKLANVLFARELSRQLENSGVNVYAVHPGVVATELSRNFPEIIKTFYKVLRPIINWFLKTAEEGAQTSLFAAIDPSLDKISGVYMADCAVSRESDYARDDKIAKQLWEESVKITRL